MVLNAVDGQQFDAPPRGRNDPLRVGFLYTAKQRKRIDLAVAALEAARARYPHLRALCFGSVPPQEDKIPLPDWIDFHLLPRQDEIPGLYAACDLWLFTSSNEGFGLPILEAMACRTPVLATRAGAAENLVTGTNGVLLDGDADVFADAMLRFAAMSDAEWRGFSAAAHATAHSYTWSDATDQLLRHLSEPAG